MDLHQFFAFALLPHRSMGQLCRQNVRAAGARPNGLARRPPTVRPGKRRPDGPRRQSKPGAAARTWPHLAAAPGDPSTSLSPPLRQRRRGRAAGSPPPAPAHLRAKYLAVPGPVHPLVAAVDLPDYDCTAWLERSYSTLVYLGYTFWDSLECRPRCPVGYYWHLPAA